MFGILGLIIWFGSGLLGACMANDAMHAATNAKWGKPYEIEWGPSIFSVIAGPIGFLGCLIYVCFSGSRT